MPSSVRQSAIAWGSILPPPPMRSTQMSPGIRRISTKTSGRRRAASGSSAAALEDVLMHDPLPCLRHGRPPPGPPLAAGDRASPPRRTTAIYLSSQTFARSWFR